jgi:hypothetical protein
MPCPDYPSVCRAPDATQRPLTAGEQTAVTGEAAAFAAETQKCRYCRLLYVPGMPPHRPGWLDGMSFHPVRKRR